MTTEIPPVKLKGVGDSFWVTVDPSTPEDVIHEKISELFERLQHLAINAKVIIDVGGAEGCDELVNNLRDFLKKRFDVGIVTTPPEKRSQSVENSRQVDLGKGWITHRTDALILTGRIRSGQKIETRRHLIIVGNVNPGAELTSSGNIIVLGSLQGQVNAGYPDNEDAFIIAIDFKPTLVHIAGIPGDGADPSLAGKIVYASIHKNKVILQDYMQDQPFGKIPWPTAL
ncbi:septum site-determining protein MinC [Desulfamplus magnetovallimortis]|nr:septum site-determining protein MinC [Desulfamplus magnetovallimortis]